jgi:hypothetical protein
MSSSVSLPFRSSASSRSLSVRPVSFSIMARVTWLFAGTSRFSPKRVPSMWMSSTWGARKRSAPFKSLIV